MSGHTPTPWVEEPDQSSAFKRVISSFSADGNRALRIEIESFKPEEDATFIVRAVNSYDSMVAALEALERQALQSHLNSPAHEWGWEALGMTRAALVLAKGGAA